MRSNKVDQLAQQVVFEVSKRLVGSVEYEEALESVVEIICGILKWQTGTFFRFDPEKQILRCDAFYSSVSCPEFEKITRSIEFVKGLGLPGRIWEAMTPQWICDVVVDNNFPRSAQARQDGLHSAFAFPVRSGDEFIGIFEFFNSKIAKPSKTMLDACAIVGNDIGLFLQKQETDRRLRLQSERLHALEAKFKLFADNVNECLFVSAPFLTRHYFVSNAFADMFWYSVEEVYADPNIWAQRIAPEDKERVMDYVSRLKGYEMPEPTLEFQIIRPDGTRLWLGVKIFAAVDQQDGTYHICGAAEDITERKAMEKRINEFYTLVSHELKTPLSSINGIFQLLEEECAGSLPKDAMQLLSLGRKECGRLIRMVNDLLDIKKIEIGKLNLQFDHLDAFQIASRTVDNLALQANEMQVQLQLTVTSNQTVRGDRDRLMQVLMNLIANAMKYSPADSAVIVSVEATKSTVRFSVSDQGPGIKLEDQASLFNLFHRIESENGPATDGTGLGLAISKAIIDQHGGTIGVESREGGGSTFWFELPLAEVLVRPKL